MRSVERETEWHNLFSFPQFANSPGFSMNRTGIFLAVAGVLALIALVVGLPRSGLTTTGTVVTTTTPIVGPSTASDGSLSMTARLSHPYVATGTSDVFVTVDVVGASVAERGERAPVNLAMVIDRSGSMSGFKLNQAKQAARQLVAQLRSTDRLAIVHYGSDVKSMDGMLATTENKERMLSYIDGIWDDGGTNIGAGLTTGRDLVLKAMSDFKVNRIVLISDGQPTEGMTDFAGLTQVVRETRNFGISVSSVGVGNDFNEELMEAFAEVGGGAYAYLQDAAQLSSIFQKDLNAAATQVARGVTLTFKAPRGARLQEVLGYKPVGRRFDGDSELVVVSLPDFAAAQNERVVARFTVDASAIGQSLDVSNLSLQYSDLLKDRAVKSEAHLAAMVTDQVEIVMKNRDKDAIVYAARARSASNTQAAVEALKNGDRAKAEQLVQQNAFYFEEAAQVAGPQGVASDVAEQKEMLDGLRNAKDDESVNTWNKESRKKARVNFGLMGSTY